MSRGPTSPQNRSSSLGSIPALEVPSFDNPDQETRPTSVSKYLRLATCNMES